MKYTKKQRHEIYKRALNEKNFDAGLCYALLDAAKECGGSWESHKLFPEFFLFRTSENPKYDYWYGDAIKGIGNEIREIVLEFCIEMTK